jgi:hypothetical protein
VPLILNSNAEVICAHGGRVVLIPRQVAVTVQGGAVMRGPDLIGAPIVGCPVPVTLVTSPCITVVSVLPGSFAPNVLVGGLPVCLETLSGLTNGRPPAPIVVAFPGQTAVQAA